MKKPEHEYVPLVALTQSRILAAIATVSLIAGMSAGIAAYGVGKQRDAALVQVAALKTAMVKATTPAGVVGASTASPLSMMSNPPPAGYCVWGKIVEVHDGDTVVFRTTYDIPVRLLDCWAPEVTGDEKPRGLLSRDHLAKYVGIEGGVHAALQDQPDRLVVPLESRGLPSRTDKYTSMGRVLGRVYKGDQNISELQVDAGFATAVKEN